METRMKYRNVKLVGEHYYLKDNKPCKHKQGSYEIKTLRIKGWNTESNDG